MTCHASSSSQARYQQPITAPSRKRAREPSRSSSSSSSSSSAASLELLVSQEFVKRCRTAFNSKPENILARNALVTVGVELAATCTEEADKIDHIFLNSIKEPGTKATDQEMTGRCWMFAGLNVFRHLLMQALGMKDLEFSETYLFFFDKLERSNTFLLEMLGNLETSVEDRYLDHLLAEPIYDGGGWHTFANLVKKYGLVPKSAMPETYHSGYSEKINAVISTKLRATACYLRSNYRRMSPADLLKVKGQTMEQIYEILVKFLGQPPEKFTWSFHDKTREPHTITDLTPQKCAALAMGGMFDLDDFVVLGHFPDKTYYKNYEFRSSTNTAEGAPFSILNIPLREIKKFASKQVLGGLPVWFGADVSKGCHHRKSAFSEKLIDEKLLFGETHPMTKSERITYQSSNPNHAMCFTGVDLDENEMPIKWQVENSWGVWDKDIPGADGFWVMTDEWFNDNVFEIVVHKEFLSEKVKNELTKDPILLQPWGAMYRALQLT